MYKSYCGHCKKFALAPSGYELPKIDGISYHPGCHYVVTKRKEVVHISH